ncbi:transcription factor WRKY45-2-like [Triticum urartu]|uniref:transcription factor WRKY45-2-like n=1 Tax=Triticum urartu TaxID=4572 RepID=UPI002043114C|nr:transcription factor WRKY45-2-like [Triticum urartu]
MALATPTAVVLELMTMGQQSAAHLGELLRAASPPVRAEHQALAAEILRCSDRVIAAVSAGATDKKRKMTDPGATSCHLPSAAMPSKRRVRAAEAHIEVQAHTTADGFVWRKYGQKDINGSNHPRLYYRCAFSGEGCAATRRVQRSQEEPAAFVIAYYGEHTCGAAFCQQRAEPLPPTVVDSGSNAWGVFGAVDRNRGSPLLPSLGAEHKHSAVRRHAEAPGDTSRRWSSPSSSSSYSSEVELGASPVEGFLDGNFDWEWETVVNSLSFGDLLH